MFDPLPLYEQIGKSIYSLRKKKKLTQLQLANELSLNRTSITNIEKGRQKILIHTLWEIADKLGVHPSHLLPKKLTSVKSSQSPSELLNKAKGISDNEKKWLKSLIEKKGGADGENQRVNARENN